MMKEALSVFDVSGSGLSAQRLRMGVIAGNIANANSLVAENGEPYRRREVIFATALREAAGGVGEAGDAAGVKVLRVEEDKEPFKMIHDPNHPLADEKGYVRRPNIDIMREMVQLTTAQRSYDANLSALKAYRDILRNSLSILHR